MTVMRLKKFKAYMTLFLLVALGFVPSCGEKSSCHLISLGDIYERQYHAYTVDIDEEEIAWAIRVVYANEMGKIYPINDRTTVKKDDIVEIDYDVYSDGVLYCRNEDEFFRVRTGNYLPDLEDQLVGKVVDVQYELDIKLPDDYLAADIAGKNVTFSTVVKGICAEDIPDIYSDNEYFQKKGYANYQEYFEYRLNRAKADKEFNQRRIAANEIIEQIAQDSVFYISQSEVSERSNKVYSAYVSISEAHELPLELYVKNYIGIDFSEFEQFCFEEAESLIKSELVRDAVMAERGFDRLSYEEYLEIGQSRYALDIGQLVDCGPKEMVAQRLLYDFLVENSNPIYS